jgi:hypothetical protein
VWQLMPIVPTVQPGIARVIKDYPVNKDATAFVSLLFVIGDLLLIPCLRPSQIVCVLEIPIGNLADYASNFSGYFEIIDQ